MNAGTSFLSDNSLNSFSATENLQSARAGCSSFVFNSKLYILGGYHNTELNTGEYADIKSNGALTNLQSTGLLPDKLTDFSISVSGSIIYLSGGFNGKIYSDKIYYTTISLNGEIGIWEEAGTFNTGLCGHASIIYNGYLYIIAGKYEKNSSEYYLYDTQMAEIQSDHTLSDFVYSF